MAYRYWLAAVMVVVPVTSGAESNRSDSTGAPAAGAPPYQSAFTHYRKFTDDEETPDARWRAANKAMAELGGHAGHVRDDATVPSGAPARVQPEKQSDGAVDHGRHH